MSIENAYRIFFSSALIWFSILILAMLIRSILGPRITDRILCINMIGTMVICCIAILSRMLKESYLNDVALIYAMISFISVLILATIYIPNRDQREGLRKQAEEEMTAGIAMPDEKKLANEKVLSDEIEHKVITENEPGGERQG